MAKDETMVETTEEKSVETVSSETNDIVSRHHKKPKVKLSVDEVVAWFDHPEMQVDREKFLRRELKNKQPQAIIEKAINPKTGIPYYSNPDGDKFQQNLDKWVELLQ